MDGVRLRPWTGLAHALPPGCGGGVCRRLNACGGDRFGRNKAQGEDGVNDLRRRWYRDLAI